MTTLWDTTGTAVVRALAAERRAAGSVSSGLALTLVVVTDEGRVSEAEQAATTAAAQHPCRLLVVVRRRPDAPEPRLDAEVLIGDRLGPGESVVMRMYGRLALHAESVVLPLLAPDAPVVTWWHTAPPELIAHDPLGVIAGRRITESAAAQDPLAALQQRARDYVPGDTDLAWTRTTLWRGLLASAFDSLEGAPTEATVSGAPGSASAALLGGWLRARLGIAVEHRTVSSPGLHEVRLQVASTSLSLTRSDLTSAVLRRTDQPDRLMPLPRRELGELLAEELRRLDADQPYAEALAAATGIDAPLNPPEARRHIWRDPAEPALA